MTQNLQVSQVKVETDKSPKSPKKKKMSEKSVTKFFREEYMKTTQIGRGFELFQKENPLENEQKVKKVSKEEQQQFVKNITRDILLKQKDYASGDIEEQLMKNLKFLPQKQSIHYSIKFQKSIQKRIKIEELKSQLKAKEGMAKFIIHNKTSQD